MTMMTAPPSCLLASSATDRGDPRALLAAWTALEVLSPRTYERPQELVGAGQQCAVDLCREPLPWTLHEQPRQNCRLFYLLILGEIPMGPAERALARAFGDDEELASKEGKRTALGAALVDQRGILVDRGIAVASFAWGLPQALRSRLEKLARWPSAERVLLDELTAILGRFDDDREPIPLDQPVIARALDHLVDRFGLAPGLVLARVAAVRINHRVRASQPPELPPLCSYLLGDLARCETMIGKQDPPGGLARYLGMMTPPRTVDLLSDPRALEKAVAPAMIPAARWPAPGGGPLVMLQQAAVDLAHSRYIARDGLLAVNGPPGTGKTTLLRDIVAAAVLDRALAMVAFDDPRKAFTPDGGRRGLCRLDPSLRGHEVLIASATNNAVENISRVLPAASAIGRPVDELQYFKSISDAVQRRSTDAADDGFATWGMIAAVLGSSANRSAFRQTFWWDSDHGFRQYLKAAAGDRVVHKVTDPATGRVIEQRTPAVVDAENPPARDRAMARWTAAREHLLELHKAVTDELAAHEQLRLQCLERAGLEREMDRLTAELEKARASLRSLQQDEARLKTELAAAQAAHGDAGAALDRHRAERPGAFARRLGLPAWRDWAAAHGPLVAAASRAAGAAASAEQALAAAAAASATGLATLRAAEAAVATARRRSAELSAAIDAQRARAGDRLIDEQLFRRGHAALHLAVPWLPDSLHHQRENLFIAAMAVHRAFIDVAARPIHDNLGIMMDVLRAGRPQHAAARKHLGDLWATLFLVVPVLSTTFASLGRMLADLPPASLGWLLIDEAGQAPPQAAVGAIMRAQRSIIVGDPQQIPPVVELPDRLTAELCDQYGVDVARWAAPHASVQTVADRASRFQATFKAELGTRQVGLPLLVHRRCQAPMFGIANKIAYDEQMVRPQSPELAGAIGRVLGPSAWLDVEGPAASKWCPAEGDAVMSLLHRLAAAGLILPDLFVITPFREVAKGLRTLAAKTPGLATVIGHNGWGWAKSRIGTIHTFQGREAEAVVLVLGAPGHRHYRAREWAAGTPNILNVAVSRARQRLYVVGSHGAWSGIGHAGELSRALPVERARAPMAALPVRRLLPAAATSPVAQARSL